MGGTNEGEALAAACMLSVFRAEAWGNHGLILVDRAVIHSVVLRITTPGAATCATCRHTPRRAPLRQPSMGAVRAYQAPSHPRLP